MSPDEPHGASPTVFILSELQLHGYRPFADESDPRPLPDGPRVADIFDALVSTLSDTRLEPDLGDLIWSTVNLFHRAAERIGRELDDNEQAQRRSQREQDGSEVRSVELERLLAEGVTLLERRDAFELMRDQAGEHYHRELGHAWQPRTGSRVNRKALTATRRRASPIRATCAAPSWPATATRPAPTPARSTVERTACNFVQERLRPAR